MFETRAHECMIYWPLCVCNVTDNTTTSLGNYEAGSFYTRRWPTIIVLIDVITDASLQLAIAQCAELGHVSYLVRLWQVKSKWRLFSAHIVAEIAAV